MSPEGRIIVCHVTANVPVANTNLKRNPTFPGQGAVPSCILTRGLWFVVGIIEPFYSVRTQIDKLTQEGLQLLLLGVLHLGII